MSDEKPTATGGSAGAARELYAAIDALEAADCALSNACAAVARCYDPVRVALAEREFSRRSLIAAEIAARQGDVGTHCVKAAAGKDNRAASSYQQAVLALSFAEMARAAAAKQREAAHVRYEQALAAYRACAV